MAQEEHGPFLRPDGVIARTVGGFELEQVLTELHPILQAVKPADLATVLDTLAQAGAGKGTEINRTIRNFSVLADTTARHDADTAQFLSSLADLSDTLAGAAPDIVDAGKTLNQVLPDLNARGTRCPPCSTKVAGCRPRRPARQQTRRPSTRSSTRAARPSACCTTSASRSGPC